MAVAAMAIAWVLRYRNERRAAMQVEPAELALPRDPACGWQARRWIEQQVGASTDQATLDDLKLVATELVDNAFVHGRGQITLKLLRTTDAFRVEVIDEGQDAAIEIQNQPVEVGGRGLMLVDGVSSAWGAHEGTTHVWAEVPAATSG
jgi:anti-sigma regulatory factor (Ser/Thr protein kinase)